MVFFSFYVILSERFASHIHRLWEASSGSNSIELRDWWTEDSTSKCGSFWEGCSVGSWFFTFVFLDVPEQFGSASVPVGSREIRQLRQSNQNAVLYPAEFLGHFFSDSAFDLLKNLCNILFAVSVNGHVPWLAVPKMFLLCFSSNDCQLSLVCQCCPLLEGKLPNNKDWNNLIGLVLVETRV